MEVLGLLLEHSGINVNLPADDGETALQIACRVGRIEMVKLLLAHRNIDLLRDPALASACMSDSPRVGVVELLLAQAEDD